MEVGLTACVPPVEFKVYELPSVPDTATCAALVAVTVSVDELPTLIEVGLAVILTVGSATDTTVTVAVAVAVPPAPVAVAV